MSIVRSYWQCPDANCGFEHPVSERDEDASFEEMLSHVYSKHPTIDSDPSSLWPLIIVKDH